MATYKVIQDIEAEDKLLGPLTLRQFIYAVIVAISGFIMFKLITVKWFLALPLLPHTILFAVLAAPFGHDQPSEVWLLARIRFFLKPRKRIWDQSGIKELVTITVPKKIEKHLTKDLNQTEVRSRLQALANTIDSRGWAVKNVNVNMFSQPAYAVASDDSDRLINTSMLPQDVPAYDIQAGDDILDEQNNATAQHLDQLISTSSQTHRQQLLDQMQHPVQTPQQNSGQPADYWFLNGPIAPPATAPGYATFNKSQLVNPGGADTSLPLAPTSSPAQTAEEQALLDKLHEEQSRPDPTYGHTKVIDPLGNNAASQQPIAQTSAPPDKDSGSTNQDSQQGGTTPVNPAILELANNDDLNVSTIARQANKATGKQPPDDEVVISLH